MNTNYDNELKRIKVQKTGYNHFEHHYSYMPFIGDKFEDSILGKKILFVAESHYISSATLVENKGEARWPRIAAELGTQDDYEKTNIEFSNIWYSDKWHSSKIKDIVEENNGKDYYNTREILNGFINNNIKGKAVTRTFGFPLKSMEQDYSSTNPISMKKIDKSKFNNFAFMNFFQRPSLKTGDAIKNNEQDDFISTNILNQVIDILKVDKVFIMSSKAYYSYINNKDCKHATIVQKLAHPCSRIWRTSGSDKQLHNYFMSLLVAKDI